MTTEIKVMISISEIFKLFSHFPRFTFMLEDCSFCQLIGAALNLNQRYIFSLRIGKLFFLNLALDTLLAKSLSICSINLE